MKGLGHSLNVKDKVEDGVEDYTLISESDN